MKRLLRYVRIKGFSVSTLGLRIPAEKISAALPGMAEGAFFMRFSPRDGADTLSSSQQNASFSPQYTA